MVDALDFLWHYCICVLPNVFTPDVCCVAVKRFQSRILTLLSELVVVQGKQTWSVMLQHDLAVREKENPPEL